MTTVESIAGDDRWERWVDRGYRVLPYFLLGVSIALAVALARSGSQTEREFVFALGVAAAALVWQACWDAFRPRWEQHRVRTLTFYTGRFVISAVLVFFNPWFGVLVFMGYIDAVRLLQPFGFRWSLAGVLATAFLVAASQLGGYPALEIGAVLIYLGVVAFNGLLASGFCLIGQLQEQQSRRRKAALDELAETNRRLEVSLQENAGLHAQLLAQAREAGVLDERGRMAREIHDTLALGLTGIITQLEAAEQGHRRPERWQRHLAQALAPARESLSEARRSVQALRPEPLEAAQLPDALAGMAERWAETAAVELMFETTGVPKPLLAEVEAALYRVGQEALTNVAKHAGASKVGVTLSYLDDAVLLDIRDDGVGFDPEPGAAAERASGGNRFGLHTMQQRLGRVAGTLEIESSPGEGVAVNARVPAIAAEGGP